MRRIFFSTFFLCCTLFLTAQSSGPAKIQAYTESHSGEIVSEFTDFLSIPNVAADTAGLRRNAIFIMDMMKKRGIGSVRLLPARTAGIPPAVYGEVLVPGATQTLFFYAHYDGQPVNPAQWNKPLLPFAPQLISGSIDKNGTVQPFPADGKINPDWRIYARSASDDKAGVDCILNGYAALRASGITPTASLKFFFEGEEEAGSAHLDEILQQYQSLLAPGLWIICDGPVHQSGQKQIVFGVRGDAHLDLTIYGPARPLHSGHYGNWAPNPAMQMARLLSSLKDDNGRVTVKGFYDDVIPLSPAEKEALAKVPSPDKQLQDDLGIHSPETPGLTLGEAINQPSLNINGMQSGNVGAMASNQIPTQATAVIDLRLVLGNDWKKQQQKVIDHISAMGYHIVDHDPTTAEKRQFAKVIKIIPGTDGYNAQRTSMDLPIAKKVIAAVASSTNRPVVLQPTSGGSLPLYLFEKYLHAPTISIPVANHDNNQHAENENIRVGNLFDGIATMAALMQIK